MDEREILIEELKDGHRMIGSALTDLTGDVAGWQPGGTANSIACLLAHTVVGEDNIVNRVFKGGQSVFESGEWSTKTGIPADNRAIWQADWSLDLEAFDSYRTEVQNTMEAFLADLQPAVLDQDVEAFGKTFRGGWLLRVVVSNHILGHTGEISALRGMKGLAGLPI